MQSVLINWKTSLCGLVIVGMSLGFVSHNGATTENITLVAPLIGVAIYLLKITDPAKAKDAETETKE